MFVLEIREVVTRRMRSSWCFDHQGIVRLKIRVSQVEVKAGRSRAEDCLEAMNCQRRAVRSRDQEIRSSHKVQQEGRRIFGYIVIKYICIVSLVV